MGAGVGAFGLAAGLGYQLAIFLVIALVLAPFLMVIDGSPAMVAIGMFPLSGLLVQHASGIGGYKIVVVFCGACWVVGRLAGWQSATIRPGFVDAAVAALLVVAAINILLLSRAGQLGLLQWYAGDLILYVFIRASIFNLFRLRWAMVSFCAGAVSAALFGFVLYGQGLVPTEENLQRLVIPGENTDILGAMMLISLGFAIAFCLFSRSGANRMLWVTVAALSALGTILTFSRGAFVGMVAMLACWLVVSQSWRLRAAAIAAAGIAVAGAVTGVASAVGLAPYVSRVTAITSLNYETTAQRSVLWSMGWHQFTTHWLFGLGVGNFDLPQFWYPLAYTYSAPRGFFAFPQQVHSFYIGWATDAGVIGLIFLGAAILGSIIQHLSLVRRSSRSVVSAPIWQGLIAGFVGYFVYTASSPDQYSQLPYIMIALMGSFAYAVRHDVPEDSASPTEAVGASSSPNRLVPRLGLVTSVRSRE